MGIDVFTSMVSRYDFLNFLREDKKKIRVRATR